ncbi:endo-1,4-beta-xylanase [Streptomyces longwoodensis]|uniref:endo-1,4-beta-xylanase n=1 Tax=Streptomyces longwoodensis TaxID=68231 RepID=UPI003700325C
MSAPPAPPSPAVRGRTRSGPLLRGAVVAGAALLTLFAAAPVTPAAPAGPRAAAQPDGPTLREAGAARGLLIGAAVGDDALYGTVEQPYYDTLATQFGLCVDENVLKWDATEPERDRFDFAAGDRMVDLCAGKGQQVKGTALAWYQQAPAWLYAITDRAEAERAVEKHIKTVVGHYRGRVQSWDVVNEAVADGEYGGLRDSWWTRVLGPDYIAKAFRWAHEADPDAKLYYNDYGNGDLGAKSHAVYDLLRGLKGRGVPVDGVGVQHHVGLDQRIGADFTRNLDRLAALGLDVALTEVDVSVDTPVTPAKLDRQAEVYRDSMRLCLAQPACKQFITWGFTDKYSWIPRFSPGYDDALPFDRDYRPKPAFFALRDALTAPAAAPATPDVVQADAAAGAVRLSWGGSPEAGTSYVVRYGTSPRHLDRALTVTDATTVRVTGLTDGRRYAFAVAAHNAAGTSAPSAAVRARPTAGPPPAPVLRAAAPDHRTLALAWRPVRGASGYVVRYGTTAEGPVHRVDVGTVTEHRLGHLDDGTPYRVEVLAYNGNGDGPASPERTATPANPPAPHLAVREAAGGIAVDGRLDEPDWGRLPVRPAKPTFHRPAAPAEAGLSWDTENVYAAVRVADTTPHHDSANPWQDDAVEIYLDATGTRPEALNAARGARHFFLRRGDTVVHEQNGRTAGVVLGQTQNGGGYTVELAVPWSNLGVRPGERGAVIGFDASVDDDVDGGDRDGQSTAYGYEENYLDLSAIGLADLRIRRATDRAPLVPLAQCVADDGDGRRSAHFGYTNDADGRVEVARGARNAFAPAPADRGQPEVFARGTHDDAVVAPFDGTPLTWTLRGPDGTVRTATVDSTTRHCPTPDDLPVYTDGPVSGWKTFTFNASADPASGDPAPVHGGSAALKAVVSGPYGLVGLNNPGAPAVTTSGTAVEFWIRTAADAPRTYQLITSDGQDGSPNSRAAAFTVEPGVWQKETVTLAELGDPARIGMLFVQDVSGAAGEQPPFYLDDIRILQVKAS